MSAERRSVREVRAPRNAWEPAGSRTLGRCRDDTVTRDCYPAAHSANGPNPSRYSTKQFTRPA
jgi:hypothetical protein